MIPSSRSPGADWAPPGATATAHIKVQFVGNDKAGFLHEFSDAGR
jgi:hypothetical protein